MSVADRPHPGKSATDSAARNQDTVDDLIGVLGAEALQNLTLRMLKEATDRLGRIDAALGRGDTDAVRDEAHTLSSSAGFLGFTALQEAAAVLELAAATGDTDGLAALFDRLTATHAEAGRAVSGCRSIGS